QTLNQLLVEMDGFGANEGVIIIAATNRPDILDRALLRPGRFDRQVYVGAPDVKGREQILRVHARNKQFDPDVSFDSIAKGTVGMTGADLENLLNEAALLAARRNKKLITNDEIEEALLKVEMGPEKKSRVVSEKKKRIVAYHEAGHAVAHHALGTLDPIHYITIIPRGGAGGFTMWRPQEEGGLETRSYFEDSIVTALGGRVAEKLIFDEITTGASGDIRQATAMARAMVVNYGMSDKIGTIDYGGDGEVFLGRDFGATHSYSESKAAEIDAEVHRIIDDAYQRCVQILTEKNQQLHDVAEYLLRNETMDGETFVKVFNGESVPDKIANAATAEELKTAPEGVEDAAPVANGESNEELPH
ncbi:MAG: AAA family ATPase, partial [Butyricicoccus sp.]|nr:AAA family ATPase [Butyricicoccus sp.]